MEREDWIQVGFACKGFGEDYFKMFDDWSAFKFCDDGYFKFLDDDMNMSKEEQIDPDVETSCKYTGTDDLKNQWDTQFNKKGAHVISWWGLKDRIKEWYPEDYTKYYEQQWEQVVAEQIGFGHAQLLRIFASYLDTKIDDSHDSDFISEDGKITKAFFRYEATGYWKLYTSGQAVLLKDIHEKWCR